MESDDIDLRDADRRGGGYDFTQALGRGSQTARGSMKSTSPKPSEEEVFEDDVWARIRKGTKHSGGIPEVMREAKMPTLLRECSGEHARKQPIFKTKVIFLNQASWSFDPGEITLNREANERTFMSDVEDGAKSTLTTPSVHRRLARSRA